jgi:hypothetical protein
MGKTIYTAEDIILELEYGIDVMRADGIKLVRAIEEEILMLEDQVEDLKMIKADCIKFLKLNDIEDD